METSSEEPLPGLQAAPYQIIAEFYDRMMAHVDYEYWSRFTLEMMMKHDAATQPVKTRLLEAACGTGTLAISLSKMGLKIDAFDRSSAMIDKAREKARSLQNPPRFFVGSFEDFDGVPPYDTAICFYDSLNYLLEAREVVAFLRKIKGVLKPGGIFLFDVCTELNSILHFNGRRERDSGVGFQFQRIMRYRQANRIQENIFEIVLDGNPPQSFSEHHRQKIYSLDEVRNFIEEAGFKLIEETDGYKRKRLTSRSLRVHFLVRKPLK